MMPNGMMRIGQVAKRFGMTPRAIRYYESIGLVQPSRRTHGGFRLYGREAIETLSAIQGFKELGLSLFEIRDVVESAAGQPAVSVLAPRVLAELERWDEAIERKLEAFKELLNEVVRARSLVQKCLDCKDRPFGRECIACWEEGGRLPLPLRVFERSVDGAPVGGGRSGVGVTNPAAKGANRHERPHAEPDHQGGESEEGASSRSARCDSRGRCDL